MRIGLDFDGVIVNSGKLKSEWAERLYDVTIDPYYFGTPYVVDQGFIPRELYEKLRNVIYNEPRVGLSLEPLPGALYYIRRLLEDGHEIRVVTARYGPAVSVAETWLARHRLSIPVASAGGRGASKIERARECDLFIDDSLLYLYQLAHHVPHRFLYSWGYNESYKEDGVAARVRSWDEFYNRVKELV